MDTNAPWEELAKYYAGELTRDKKEKMESWINADPQRKKKVQKLYRVWKESGTPPYQLDVKQAWIRLSRNMDNLEREILSANQTIPGIQSNGNAKQYTQNYNEHRRAGGVMRRVVMTAVAAVVMLTAGLFTYYNYSAVSNEATELVSRELIAQNGERATYVLNDGSRIILHAGSRVEIPVQFNDSKRELFLEGEAYFEVTHDVTKPFIVHSEHAKTRVLGTKFLLQAWPDSQSPVEVVVSEGKVAFGSRQTNNMKDQKEVIVTRNQKGVLAPGTDAAVLDGVDMKWHMGWTQGKLVFNNRPLDEIIPKLERWYAIEIKIEKEEIGVKKLTAEIDYTQPMGEVLKGIALSLDLELEESGRTVTFLKG